MPRPQSSQPGAVRRTRRLLATGVALLLALAGAAPAAASPDPEQGFGLNVQSLLRGQGRFSDEQVAQLLPLMARDGLRTARMDLLWSKAEPAAPDAGGTHRYSWALADQTATRLATAGLRWVPLLTGAPGWASVPPGDGFGSPRPERQADFAAFAAAFAVRYGPGGAFWAEHPELPALPIGEVAIWNEPNTEVHWGTTPDPAAYASLFAQAQAAIKAARPELRVLIGGIVWNDDAAYLRGVLHALGPGVAVDGVDSHPYAPTVFSILPNVQRMRGVLDAAGRPGVPLHLNELGWPAAYDRAPSPHGLDGPVSDEARAGTLALTVDALSRSTCDIGSIMVYDLVEAEDNPTFVESLMGVYRRDGSATRTSEALRDAVARYRATAAAPGPPVPVCGARGAKATRLLPLRMTAQLQPDGCAVPTVLYRGLPIEEAQVRVLAPYSGVKATDAQGRAAICPPAPGGNAGLRMVADVPGAAASNLVVCDPRCRTVGAATACALGALKVVGRAEVARVRRVGLALRTAGCVPQQGDPVRLRVKMVISKQVARRLGFNARRSPVAVGTGTALLQPGGRVTLRAKLSRRARRALAGRRGVRAELRVSATEDGATDRATRLVRLR